MEKDYVIKSVSVKKDSTWKIFSIGINYYHQNKPDFVSNMTFSPEDFKKLYWDLDINTMVGQRVWLEKKLILR